MWEQPLVITNFDFLHLLREKQDLNNEGIEISDFYFDSYGKAFEVLLQCLSESIQPIETEFMPVENTGLIPVIHQLNSSFIIGTWKNQTSNTLWASCIS